MAKKKQEATAKAEQYTNLEIDLNGLEESQKVAVQIMLFEGRLREREEILAELKAVLPATMESAYWAGLMQAVTIVQKRHAQVQKTPKETAPETE